MLDVYALFVKRAQKRLLREVRKKALRRKAAKVLLPKVKERVAYLRVRSQLSWRGNIIKYSFKAKKPGQYISQKKS